MTENNCNIVGVSEQKSSPSNPIEYVIYYERKPDVRRPTAVISGIDWTQVNNDQEEINKYVQKNGIISIQLNTGSQEIETCLTRVKHSNDLLIIHSKQSVIYIYGEKGDGLKVGSKALIKISGLLQIFRNEELYAIEGGRHTIEPTTGDLKFIICDEKKVVLIGSNFRIDDESYLDTNQTIK